MSTIDTSLNSNTTHELDEESLSAASGGNWFLGVVGSYLIGKALEAASKGEGVPTSVAKGFMNAIGQKLPD